MIKAERHDRVLSELARRGAISVQELAGMLDVSEATIRRDLNDLDERNLVRRTHGGVTLSERDDELPYQFKVTSYLAEKRRIGAAVAAMISANQVVGCTGGTTVAQVMKVLRSKPISVVTNAVNIAMELVGGADVEVLVTGGTLRGRTYELVGHVAERTLADVMVDVALLGVDGISLEHGLTTFNQAEAFTSRRLTERAKQVWVVADHSKFDQVRPAVIAGLDVVRRIVTDTAARPEQVDALRALGIDVVLA